jgi:hypothetical protein
VQLTVTGAMVESVADRVRIVLHASGRKIAYGRVRVTDATGRELQARMELRSEAAD